MASAEKLAKLQELQRLLALKKEMEGRAAPQQAAPMPQPEPQPMAPQQQAAEPGRWDQARQLGGTALRQALPPLKAAEFIQSGDFDKLKSGVGLSATETALGAKGLVSGGLSDEEEQILKMWRGDVDEAGGWGTAGRVLGEVAQLAVPASKASKLSKAIGAAKEWPLKAQRLMSAAGDAATAAGLEYLQAPEEGKTRLRSAVEGGLGGMAGYGVGEVLGKSIRGIQTSDVANRLMDKGMTLTPGQAAKGGLPKALEFTMGWTPFLSGGTQKIQQESVESFNKQLMKEAAAPGKDVTTAGVEGFRQLHEGYNQAYKDAWAKATKPKNEGVVKMVNQMSNTVNDLGEAAEPFMRKAHRDLAELTANYTPNKLKAFDRSLRKQQQAAYKDPNLSDSFKQLRETLRESIGDDAGEELAAINKQYGSYDALRNTAGKARIAEERGFFTPGDAVGGSAQTGGKTRTALGESPLLQTAVDAAETIGRRDKQPIIDQMKALVGFFPSPTFAMRPLANPIMGRTAPQAQARHLADVLRKAGISPTSVGAAVED